jgi:hypothetical protein
MFVFKSIPYCDISSSDIKQIRKLLRNITGENLSIAQKTDITYLAYLNNMIVGFGMISKYSPENHFKDENPYLYNFVTDIYHKKDEKCSYKLLDYIHNSLKDSAASKINLDVLSTNKRAFKFFDKNKYKVCGKYKKTNINKLMLSDIKEDVFEAPNKEELFICMSKDL